MLFVSSYCISNDVWMTIYNLEKGMVLNLDSVYHFVHVCSILGPAARAAVVVVFQ
jgi:hypothetical protein